MNVKLSQSVPGLEAAPAFFNDLIDTLTERGRSLLGQKAGPEIVAKDALPALGELLLSRRGEASGVALAQTLFASYNAAPGEDRLVFLQALADRFGPDRPRIELAIEAVRQNQGTDALEGLHAAAEPRRQELIRRLNLAPGGTSALVRMREELLEFLPKHPELKCVDADFSHLLSSWFNRGFLVLRPIDWTTPANILEKIIRYEAVHAINDWNDLRNRLQPPDRRCFAVFYSISNTQRGLGGVSFGNFLIKQVVDDLKRELPGLETFVTLSPVPGFAKWLARERKAEASAALPADLRA